jgi:pectinesterase
MKQLLSALIGLCVCTSALTQSLTGITHKADTSYTNYSAYLSTKKTHPETQWVADQSLPGVAEEKARSYTRIGNRQLLLDVFYPEEKSKRNHIAILFIHGGGWRTGNRTQHYPLARQLAQLGYTVYIPEYRLSTEALFPAAVYDLKAAIRWVKENAKQYAVDSTRICAAGFSAGGELAAFLGVTGNLPLFEGTQGLAATATNVQAVIDIDGILSFVHPESGEGDDSKRTSAATYWLGYPKKGHEKIWETASSLSYVSAFTPPTLFLNSSVARMHAGREDYISVLRSFNTYTEVHGFEKAPHAFCLFEPWFTPTLAYMDGFLKKVFYK